MTSAMTAQPLNRRWRYPALLHPSPKLRIAVILLLLALISVAHNGVNLPSAPFVMILSQKLYFIPVILAGFWSGSRGGLLIALVAAVLYPHHGHMHMPDAPMFSAGQSTDIVLLFIVGGMTGWLRDALRLEAAEHQLTAGQRDQALKEARQSFERAQRTEHLASLGRMAAGIAHEVRNPLTSIQGAVDILRRAGGEKNERVSAMTGILQREIANLDRITGHFLQFARPSEACMKRLNPNMVLEYSVSVMRAQAEAKDLRIRLELQRNQCFIRADGSQIQQVLVNLIINAIQFAHAKSEITVRSGCNHGQWFVHVINRGQIIPEPDRTRIFDPFYTTRADGTGLGLAIATRIAHAHGGTLEVECADGETVFMLGIPEVEA